MTKYKVPMSLPELNGNEKSYLAQCIDTSWVSSQGRFINEFESKFAEFVGVNYCSSTSNGTTALHLALLSLGIGEGDEVLVPNITFAATANAVIYCGAKPVLVDINEESWGLDVEAAQHKLTERTKAIIAVHLYGRLVDIEAILKFKDENKLFLIEDCAESIGATYRNKQSGSFGDISCFSFYGNKIITTGEGGMVATSSASLLEKINMIKNHGMLPNKRYWHDVVGYNYRMTNMQAAIGLAQLEQLESFLDKRQAVMECYQQSLRNISSITIPEPRAGYTDVCWLFTIQFKKNSSLMDIEKLQSYLLDYGVDSRRVFYPLNIQAPYRSEQHYPQSEAFFERTLSLPTYTQLSPAEILYVAELIKTFEVENYE